MTRHLLLALTFLLLLASIAGARDITLAWDANAEPDIVGYKVYYQADSPQLPLDGTDASYTDESGVTRLTSSPVDIGNKTTVTLKGLDAGKIYYFAVTAYNSAGYESSLSEIIASDWVPVPLSPANGATVSSSFQLTWSPAPQEIDVTYTLYYGTDPELKNASAIPVSPSGPSIPAPPAFLAPALAAFLALSFAVARRRRRLAYSAAASFLCVLVLASCGGGGGGGGGGEVPGEVSEIDGGLTEGDPGAGEGGLTEGAPGGADGGTPEVPFTTSVPVQSATARTLSGLKPGTYYWKVVANDGQKPRESTISTFTVQ